VLIECSVAKAFWEQTKAITGVKLPPLHHESWAHDLIEGRAGSKQSQPTILIGMYALWMQRNRRRHGEQALPVRVAVQWAIDLAFDLLQVGQSQTTPGRQEAMPRWEKPTAGWFKCNTDGAFYDRQWKGAIGAVLRNATRGFVRATA
jgi:hypothetical protein